MNVLSLIGIEIGMKTTHVGGSELDAIVEKKHQKT